MKNLITLLFVVVSISLLAQSPQKFNYQAVVRNADGTVIKNQSVNFRMTIFEGSTTGLIKYQETQAGTTNKYGLISLAIGNGIISAGSMASIKLGVVMVTFCKWKLTLQEEQISTSSVRHS